MIRYKLPKICLVFFVLIMVGCTPEKSGEVVLDDTDKAELIEDRITIDSVWSGHPVGFSLYTDENRQYIVYYNSNRNTVVGQRMLNEDSFQLYVLPETYRETNGGTSSVLGWDSHNYMTMAIDKDGFIHLSGNVHRHPLTYYRSTKPYDITTVEQVYKMVGTEEQHTTYPRFMLDKNGELIYQYRDGGSGDGNEIYNIYDTNTKSWSRMFESSLTDGQGLMNAYQTQPTLMKDNWFHIYWVWRNTPDASTNHDLSYMKSPDLKKWYDAYGNSIELPATLDKQTLIVDPIPVEGGIINLAAKLLLDEDDKAVFVYHKFDEAGNTQLYIAQLKGGKWTYHTITEWDYRWEFSGYGSIGVDIRIKSFRKRNDGYYEVDFWHKKYGDGTVLLDKDFTSIGKVIKAQSPEMDLVSREGFLVKTADDLGNKVDSNTRFILKWETLPKNRDKPREKPLPKPSKLELIKLKKKS